MRLEFKDLTYFLCGISFAPGANRGPDMYYTKYWLSKTGMFPKWEPRVSDVLCAAFRAYDIRRITTPRGHKYYCVIPDSCNFKDIYGMLVLFRANGVILMPKMPKKSNFVRSPVFWVRDRGQRFMHDVMRVNQNANNFQTVLSEHQTPTPATVKQSMFSKLFGRFENEK